MGRFRIARSPREKAAALLIVLAMVVLLTGLAIAYLSRTTSDRPVAHASFHQSRVDVLAQSAMDLVIGDLQQEITNGSTALSEPDGSKLYTPTSAANIVPQRRANAAGVSNLIRRKLDHGRFSQRPFRDKHSVERPLPGSEREHSYSRLLTHPGLYECDTRLGICCPRS